MASGGSLYPVRYRTDLDGQTGYAPPRLIPTNTFANKLLASLPPPEYRRIQPFLSRVTLKPRQVLHATGQRMRAVYFPVEGVCSIVGAMEDGRMMEVAAVGREGMVGAMAIFGNKYPGADAVAQLPGFAEAMPLEAFASETRRRGPFYDVVAGYAGVLLSSLTLSAACNGLHAADERCARWLLHTHDRVGKDAIACECYRAITVQFERI
jgi:CRP-like cAMP-binding protein